MLGFDEKITKWLEPTYFGVLLLALSFVTGFFSYVDDIGVIGNGW